MNLSLELLGLVSRPATWPRPYRRAFVLTFPVSIPLLAVSIVALVVLAVLESIARSLVEMWR